MNRTRARKSLIAEEGGWDNGQRDDPGGGKTIGVGHHMSVKVTQDGYRAAMNQPNYNGGAALLPSNLQRIPNNAVNQILNDDIDRSVIEARDFLVSPSLWGGLGDVRREVVMQMAFQMGPYSLAGFTKFLQALQRRDYDDAADEMLDSKWAREDSPSRARRMANAMRHNDASYFQQGEDPYSGG